ncbi:MAG: putative DNA binding domain-containing protein [Planctomycetes bacterium]|nr:putative DNA binding domain-containing protein [Planctomycetota bacterium]
MTYPDQELEELLADLESDRAERKETLNGDAATEIREAVCAFANDLPDHRRPGVVIVGAKDDGSPSGITVTDELLQQLADIRSDGQTVPPPTLTVEKRRLAGVEMAVVTVAPSDSPPVRYKGRTWIRVGPRRAIASAQEERILNEKRRHRDPHFDTQPVSTATLDDLSRRAFEDEYLPQAVAPDVLAANDRSYEQRLAAMKMVASADEPIPTVAGILVLGTRPRDFLPSSYVQFLRIHGVEHGDPVTDEAVCDGPIPELIRQLDGKLASHNRTMVDISSGPIERRESSYPRVALEQLTRNAIMHRTYESTNAPVHVYWFDDRIEIFSPGGPYGLVRRDTFGQPGVVDYRNPTLAESMRVLGLAQRFGFGIALARRELDKAGHPEPEFDIDANWVRCCVRARP